jgi:methyltransferase (TIGR00027 family)
MPARDDCLDSVARTARWTAAERARESARPNRLFEDPLAEVLAGEKGRGLATSMARYGGGENPWFAVRTRFFDDALTDSVPARRAVAQVVLVAAGLDTRAYRREVPTRQPSDAALL